MLRGHSITTVVEKMRRGGGQKMSVFVHAHVMKTVHAGGGGQKKWPKPNSVHVVVECPLCRFSQQNNTVYILEQ